MKNLKKELNDLVVFLHPAYLIILSTTQTIGLDSIIE